MKEKDYLAFVGKERDTAHRQRLVLQAMLKAGRSSLYSIWKICWIRLTNPLSSAPSTFFLSHHLIHSIDDGQVLLNMRYAVQAALCGSQRPAHTYFHCELQQDILLPEYPYTGSTSTGRIYAEQHQLCTERALSGMCKKIKETKFQRDAVKKTVYLSLMKIISCILL